MERPEECMDLFDFITKKTILSETTAGNFFRQIVYTVTEIVDCGVINGDIKDENMSAKDKTLKPGSKVRALWIHIKDFMKPVDNWGTREVQLRVTTEVNARVTEEGYNSHSRQYLYFQNTVRYMDKKNAAEIVHLHISMYNYIGLEACQTLLCRPLLQEGM